MSPDAREVPWENWALMLSLAWLALCADVTAKVAAIEQARPRPSAPPAAIHQRPVARSTLQRMEDYITDSAGSTQRTLGVAADAGSGSSSGAVARQVHLDEQVHRCGIQGNAPPRRK